MIDVISENLCINKIVGSKNFEVTAQGDSIIPDTKPDILSDISASGNVCIYKKEILERKNQTRRKCKYISNVYSRR